MTESIFSPASVTVAILVIGNVFFIYNYFRNPQIRLEKGEGLMSMSINQLQKDLANLRDNHVHTIDVKLDDQGKSIRDLTIQVTKLQTIIEERMPKRIGS